MRSHNIFALCLAVAVVAATSLIPLLDRKCRADPTHRAVASLFVTCGGLALIAAAVALASGN
jgi:hypothetical protein